MINAILRSYIWFDGEILIIKNNTVAFVALWQNKVETYIFDVYLGVNFSFPFEKSTHSVK